MTTGVAPAVREMLLERSQRPGFIGFLSEDLPRNVFGRACNLRWLEEGEDGRYQLTASFVETVAALGAS